jgi:hypothetical protein
VQDESQSKKPRVMQADEQPEELPAQPEVIVCAPDDGYINVDEVANVGTGMPLELAPVVRPEDMLAASRALSCKIIADFLLVL